jgi:uncharacterized protein YndB with AHSA1/START domain
MRVLIVTAALALVPAAAAKVGGQGPNGFAVTHEATVSLTPQAAYERFLKIGTWWSKDHTFSGDPKNITIDAKPGGCWCEALPDDGFVKHMEAASAAPGKRLVFHGGLGPLHFMAVAGTMTVAFAKEGEGTKVTLRYSVAGYDPDQFAKLAPAVDAVLGEQLANYAKIEPQ